MTTIIIAIIALIILPASYWYLIGKATSKGFSDEGWEDMDLESKQKMAEEELKNNK